MSIEVLVPISALTGLSLFARVTLGSWLAPGAFFPLVWTCLIMASMMVPEYPLWHVALWWIFVSLLFFYAGSFVGGVPAASSALARLRKGRLRPQEQIRFPKLDFLVLVSILLGFVYALFRGLFAPTVMDTPPLWFQFILSFLYVSPILGGMLFASASSNRSRRLAVLSVAPALFFSVANMGRSPLLASVFFWLAGYWPGRVLQGRGVVPLLTKRVIFAAPLLLLTLSVTGAAIGALRIVGVEERITLVERLASYPQILKEVDMWKEWSGFKHGVFAHPYAFSHYLRYALANPPTPHYGALTFSGPLDLLGLHARTPFESFEVEPGIYTNVYTLFMPPIEDFGLEGSLVVFFGSGFIAGWAYRRVAQGNLLPIPVLTMFYPHVMVIGGYFFSYNSIVLAHLLVGVYLYWAQRKLHRKV